MSDRRVDLARLISLSESAPAGRLVLATSCSWRRILTERGGSFLVPTVDLDGHPNLDTTAAAEFVTELVNWFRDNADALVAEAQREVVVWMSYSAATGKPVFDTEPPDEPNIAGWRPLVLGDSEPTRSRQAAEQEKADPVDVDGRFYVEARQCEDCDHSGINDSSDVVSACSDCEWQGPTPDEDKCPGCAHQNCMAVACPICGGRYRFLADRWFTQDTAPPAKRVRVPDALAENAVIFGDADDDGYRMGWNACRAAMLSAAPEATTHG